MPLSLLAVVLVVILYIQPAYSDMRNLQKSVADGAAQLSEIQAQQNKLSSIQSSLGTLEGKSLVDAALPENSDQEDYLVELYQRSSKSGIILNSVNFSGVNASQAPFDCSVAGNTAPLDSSGAASSGSATPAAAAEGGSTAAVMPPVSPVCADGLGVDISVTGSWDQILNFLKYATDSNRLANITGVDLGAGNNGSGSPDQAAAGDILNAKISLEIYSKVKSATSNPATIASLVSGQGFDRNALQSLISLVYAPYAAPSVSQTGERNIFK